MAKQLQLRAGTTAEHATFTGAAREITVDTDKNVPVIHDGVTAGGFPVQSENIGTAGRVIISDGSGVIAVSDITSTEVGYLDGVTSNIQDQLNDKEPAFTKNTAFNKNFGTTSGTVCEGDDSRFPVTGTTLGDLLYWNPTQSKWIVLPAAPFDSTARTLVQRNGLTSWM